MKKVNYNNILSIVYLLLAVISGVVIGKIIDFPFFELDKHLNIVEISSIITTILAAFLITNVLEKNKQDSRIEKDLLIKRLGDIDHLFDDIITKIGTDKYSYIEAASTIKRIRTSFVCIFNLIEKTKIELNHTLKEKVTNELGELKDLLTDTPQIQDKSIQKSNLSITVKNNILVLSKTHAINIETKINSLKNDCINLQFDINKG